MLLEGKAGNLTDLTLGMVLAEKPLVWLQVMHGRMKHLIISSEMFKEKKKAEYNAWTKAKQIHKGKGMGNTPRESGFWGLVERERGKEKGSVGKTTATRLRLQLTILQEINKHLTQQ